VKKTQRHCAQITDFQTEARPRFRGGAEKERDGINLFTARTAYRSMTVDQGARHTWRKKKIITNSRHSSHCSFRKCQNYNNQKGEKTVWV